MIDWARVLELREEVGEDDFDEVVDLFLEEVETAIDQLRQGPGADKLECALHFLKGSAQSLGFSAFSDLCSQGERLSSQGMADKVDVTAVIDAYDRSKADFLGQLPSRL